MLITVGTKKPPPKKNRKRRLPKTLTSEEVARTFALLDTSTFDGLRDRCCLELMYRAGLRVGEVVKLTQRDVDLDEGSIRILDGKGGDGTAYFDPARVSPWIRQWIDDASYYGRHPGPTLFCHQDGRPLNTRYLQRLVARLKQEAGIEAKFTPHTLRHTYATELLNEGFNLREVQTALRHANVGTTEIYTAVINKDLSRKMNARGDRIRSS